MTQKLKEMFRKAADIIDQRGLAKTVFQDDMGRVCLRGALSVAEFGDAWHFGDGMTRDADRVVLNYLVGRGENVSCPADWNNRTKRTQEEVTSVLRELGEEPKPEPEPEAKPQVPAPEHTTTTEKEKVIA